MGLLARAWSDSILTAALCTRYHYAPGFNLPHLYWWCAWGPEKSSDLPKATELVSGRARIQMQPATSEPVLWSWCSPVPWGMQESNGLFVIALYPFGDLLEAQSPKTLLWVGQRTELRDTERQMLIWVGEAGVGNLNEERLHSLSWKLPASQLHR